MTLNAPPGFEANFKTLHDYKLIHNKWTYSQKQKMSVFLNLTKKLTSMGKKASKALVYQFTRADKTQVNAAAEQTAVNSSRRRKWQCSSGRQQQSQGRPSRWRMCRRPGCTVLMGNRGKSELPESPFTACSIYQENVTSIDKNLSFSTTTSLFFLFGVFCVPSGLTEKPSVMRWT